MRFILYLLSFFGFSASVFTEGIHVWGEMFDQAVVVHLPSSSAVYRLCAVPTGCSGGLRPCMWRGAEGRRAPGWGSRTGTAGTVLLLQERAVQTAWRSGQHTATHPQTRRFKHTQTCNKDTKRRTRTERCGEDGQDKDGQKARGGGRVEGQGKGPSQDKRFSPQRKKVRSREDCGNP